MSNTDFFIYIYIISILIQAYLTVFIGILNSEIETEQLIITSNLKYIDNNRKLYVHKLYYLIDIRPIYEY